MKDTLFVTDAGSVSIGGTLFLPGSEIPIEKYAGREGALREHVQNRQVSTRRQRMRTDESGRVIKIDRRAGAPALPSVLEDNDRKRRELRPLSSSTAGNQETATALAHLMRKQQVDEVAKGREAKEVAEEAARLAAQEAKEAAEANADKASLAQIAEESAPSTSEFEEVMDDELFEEDAELLANLEDSEES